MQIVMPKLNDAADAGVVNEILVKPGDAVSVGDAVLAMEMEKAIIQIEATAAGNLLVQAIGSGEVSGIDEAREIVRQSFPITEFRPKAKAGR